MLQDVNLKRGRLRFTVGWGRVYSDCWYLLDIVGEPFDYAQGIARPYRFSIAGAIS
jgi:hypothetical protein